MLRVIIFVAVGLVLSQLRLSWLPTVVIALLPLTFITLLVLAVIGKLDAWPSHPPSPLVSSSFHRKPQGKTTLFVLVHGFNHNPARWDGMASVLGEHGDVLRLEYPSGVLSNAEPDTVARGVSEEIEKALAKANPARIVIVAHSIGALVARKALLYAVGGTDIPRNDQYRRSWGDKVNRVVLLAGTNRGWDIAGNKPLDMSPVSRAEFWLGSWFGRLAGAGKLILATETGSPFVANLRLEWMRWLGKGAGRAPLVEVVQILGDIDDVVSDGDNKDLSANASANVAWLKVRGTGHADIVDLGDGSRTDDLRGYRRDKVVLATTRPFEEVLAQNEEQPLGTDRKVTHVVFIVHGIRDLGRWASQFEAALQAVPLGPREKRAVVSIRYGYFGMGPFLLRGDRQKYVRWFMDRYTETLARFPEATRIDFVGHSNGTYLLGSALQNYESLKVARVVFAGSVLQKAYDWPLVFARKQVERVRNYVASDDWVVALFTTLFEQIPLCWFGNDIGSAGFNGFRRVTGSSTTLAVENVEFIRGQHSAFLSRVPAIVNFVTQPNPPKDSDNLRPRDGWVVLKVVSDWLCWSVWLALASIVLFVGFRVTGASAQPAWPMLVAYVVLIVLLLRSI